MPIVEISFFEGRGEEVKARLVREITNVMAEVLSRPMEGIHIVINEKRREDWAVGGRLGSRHAGRPSTGRIDGRADFAWISEVECPPEKLDDYHTLRRDVINPVLARTDGYVDSMLFRSRREPNRFVGITRWMDEEINATYRSSDIHAELREKSIAVTGTANTGGAYDIIHEDGR